MQGADAFDRVHEEGDGGEVIPDREFAACEDRSAGHAELAEAGSTLPNLAGAIGVNLGAFAIGAEGRAAVVREPDLLKAVMRFIVRHPHDAFQAQRAGFGGKEEVLSHQENLNLTC